MSIPCPVRARLTLPPLPGLANLESQSDPSVDTLGYPLRPLPGSDRMVTPPTSMLHPSPRHPSSFTLHPVTRHPSPVTLHPSPVTRHPSSFILHPSSFILHPSPPLLA